MTVLKWHRGEKPKKRKSLRNIAIFLFTIIQNGYSIVVVCFGKRLIMT